MVAGRSLTEYSSIVILYGSVLYGSVLYGWIFNWLGLWCSVCHRVRVRRLHWFVLRIFDWRSVPDYLHVYLL